MYRSTVNNQHEYEVVPGKDGQTTVNGQLLSPDMVEIRQGLFHIILNGISTEAEVVSADYTEKVFHIRVNGNTYKVQVADRYDALLREMGMDLSKSRKVSELKAPMPGLVSEVSVTEGQELKKGDKALVGNKAYRRYIKTSGKHFEIDLGKLAQPREDAPGAG